MPVQDLNLIELGQPALPSADDILRAFMGPLVSGNVPPPSGPPRVSALSGPSVLASAGPLLSGNAPPPAAPPRVSAPSGPSVLASGGHPALFGPPLLPVLRCQSMNGSAAHVS